MFGVFAAQPGFPGRIEFSARTGRPIIGIELRDGQPLSFSAFIRVVATLNPIADDQSDVPAQWSVTFAVDDGDATAERAAALGARSAAANTEHDAAAAARGAVR